MSYSIPDPGAWRTVAEDIVSQLKSGDIFALSGPLGAGKTTFVQALAEVLGAERSPKSPTFTLLKTYRVHRGEISRLLHLDAYRISREVDLLPLDLDEELGVPGTILVLEWPEHVSGWLSKRPHRTITIALNGEGRTAELH